MKAIFKYDSYLGFLQDWLESRPGRGRGLRTEIAQITDTHATFVSQVLKGKCHFSLEHGLKLATFLGLGIPESRYFSLLLLKERAGTRELAGFFQTQLDEIRAQQTSRKAQTKLDEAPEQLNKQVYFSSWLYATVHLLCQLKGFSSVHNLAERLSLDRAEVTRILHFLESSGLIEASESGYRSGTKQFYLEPGSPFLMAHQLNWRLKSCQDIQSKKPGTHFTAAVSLTNADAARIQEILDKAIADSVEVAKASTHEEEVFCFSMDLFRA